MPFKSNFILLACCFILSSEQVSAQKFEWLNNTQSNKSELSSGIVGDSLGFIYMIGVFDTILTFNNNITESLNNKSNSYVIKYDSAGNMIWLRTFAGCRFLKLLIDKENRVIICGSTDVFFTTQVGSITPASNEVAHFFLALDLNGIPLTLKNIGFNGTIFGFANDKTNNFLITGVTNKNTNIDGDIISGINTSNIFSIGLLAQFNRQFQINWISKVFNTVINDITVDESKNIYSTGIISNTTLFDSIQISSNGGNDIFVSKQNFNGKFLWVKSFGGLGLDQGRGIRFSKNKVFLTGTTTGNIRFDTISISSNPLTNFNAYIVRIDTLGKVENAQMLLSSNNGNSFLNHLIINKFNEVICIGQFSFKLKIGNLDLSSLTQNTSFICKLDSFLNPIYLININSPGVASGISSFMESVYYSGTLFSNQIRFGPFNRQFSISSNNAFLTKILDISLRKDSLLEPTPYCAGDSISIRYSKRGTYNFGNTFYAQLSNRFGNYDSNTLIIGSRLDTASGIIRCKLPDSLRTSAFYQMRLFSDSPAVNSFPDTTSYLIYAQPKADAGTDTLLCRGQAAFIPNTSKADTFSWSPANLLIDARKKEVQSLPLNNRTSFILKATIGVCSKYDTVNLTFRSRLRINASDDSTICDNDTITLESFRAGGDSLGYSVQWFEIGQNTNWQLRAVDTNSYTVFNLPPGAPSQFAAVLTDGCTVIPDTAFIAVTTRDPLIFNLPTTQAICEGLSTSLQVQATGGIDAEYKFIWRNATGTVLADTNILEINPATIADTLFIIQLTDGCSAPIADTIALTVSNKPNASYSVDTTQDCQPLTVQFLYTGSQSAVNTFNWQFSDGQTSTIQNPQMVFPNVGVYGASLIVNNGCLDTVIQDSFITVFEQSLAAFTATPLEAELPNAVITFENNSTNSISYKWLLPNDQFDTVFEPELILKDTGLYQLVLIAKSKDGCLDTASQQVRVIEVFKLEIPNVFTPNGDGKNDTWNFEGTGYTVNEITLFNRWGTIVYNNNKPQVSWDGKDNNGKEITAGTYFYALRLVTIDGITKELKGTVAVMR